MYGKVMDNYTFMNQALKDFETYKGLNEEDKVAFLSNIQNNYRIMMKNLLSDADTIFKDFFNNK